MPAGASQKRERQFKNLEHRFKKEGRYRGRETEVAARIVNKQRAQFGETREQRRQDRQGRSPDRGLPLPDYDRLTVAQIDDRLGSLSNRELERIRSYEARHRRRKTLMRRLERRLHS